MRRTCQCVILRTGEVSSETSYGITSLGRDLAQPVHLEAFWRGHWTIENKVHHVRAETLREDRGQTHTGSAPQALAAPAQRHYQPAALSRLEQHRQSPAPLWGLSAASSAVHRLARNLKLPWNVKIHA
jgi:hypothetical protein